MQVLRMCFTIWWREEATTNNHPLTLQLLEQSRWKFHKVPCYKCATMQSHIATCKGSIEDTCILEPLLKNQHHAQVASYIYISQWLLCRVAGLLLGVPP